MAQLALIPTFSMPEDNIGTIIESAIREQDQIRWINVIKGYITPQWGKAQDQFYQ